MSELAKLPHIPQAKRTIWANLISSSLALTTRAGSGRTEAYPDLNQCRPKDEINLATTGTVGEAPQGLGSLRGLKFTVLRTRSLALSQWSWVGAKLRDTRR
jgi:hypothetical protein